MMVLSKIHIPLIILWLAISTACSDLAIFVAPPAKSNLEGVSLLGINDDGTLNVEWTLKSGTGNGQTYDAYLLELAADDARYKFTDEAVSNAPLLSEALTVPYEDSPLKTGTLAASASQLSLSLPEILKPDRKYLLQLVEKRATRKGSQAVLLLKVDFKTNVPGTAKISQDKITITWTDVPGANSYEVYADETMNILLGTSTVNELVLDSQVARTYRTFFVRPLRGALAAKQVVKVELTDSNASIVKVKSTKPDGRYTLNQVLDFEVTFTQAITVFGDASLPLEMDSLSRNAEYVSGSGTTKLLFRHTVLPGDDALILDNARVLSGTYTDANGLTIAASVPSESGASLKENSAIAIDATSPTNPIAPGFNLAATVSGNFTLSWGASSDSYFKDYATKLCHSSDCSTACGAESLTTSTSQNFSAITEGSYYGCVQARDESSLRSAWVSTLNPVSVDTTGPSVLNVAAVNDGLYKEGQAISIAVKFNEIVTAAGTNDLKIRLETGSVDRDASYVSGSGTDTLIFEYIPQLGDTSSDLNYKDTDSLLLGSVGLIKDFLNNAANVTLPASASASSLAGQSQVIVDTTAPTSPTAIVLPGTHSLTTSFLLNWTNSSDANFKTHQIKLCSLNDCATSCATAINSLSSPATVTASNNSSSFACVRGEDNLGHTSAWSVSASSITVDASPPSVTRVSSTTANGDYKAGDTLSVTVEFSESVTVGGAGTDIKLQLETGATDNEASFVSGSGSNTLTFEYLIVGGDESLALNYHSINALTLGASTIRDSAGNNANLTLPALNSANALALQKTLSIDTTPPSAPTAVGFDSALSSSINFNVNFGVSADANLDTHNIKLCSDQLCSVACSAVTQSSFSPAGLSGVNAASYYACVQGVDTLGHTTAWVSSATQVTIDTSAATVLDVNSAKADGLYTSGEVIDIAITFSEDVLVTGGANLRLALATTPNAASAVYQSGSGTNILNFRYTVGSSENSTDLQYPAINSLTRGAGATLKDAAGNDAALTLPALGGLSLGAQKAIRIDTLAPSNPQSVSFPSGISNSTDLTLNWTDSSDLNFSTHRTKLCASSDCSSSCLAVVDALSITSTLPGADNASYYGCVQGVDQLGLVSEWVSSAASVSIDASPPSVTSVTSSKNDGAYKEGEIIPLQVVFSENVYLTNENDLSLLLAVTGPGRAATFVSGDGTNTLNFTYTVQAGDNSSDLNYVATNSLDLGASATIRDAAGSNALLALPALISGSSLGGSKAIAIDTTAPPAPVITSPADGSTSPTNITQISGTSEANALIEVKNGSTVLGTITATGTNWTYTLNPVFSDGTYTISATASDAAGNTGPASVDSTFTIDTTNPLPPVIAALVSPSIDTTPTISGTAEAGMTIKVYADGVLLDDTTADGSGNWSMTSSVLSDGPYTLTAIATDNLSRDSAASTGVPYSVDTTNPPAPQAASFAGPTTSLATFPLSWTASATLDPHHLRYNAKLCDTASCDGTCISLTSSDNSPTDVLGEDSGSYYGCVQAEDSLNHVSSWTATPAPIAVDTVGATIESVSSTKGNGVYTTGELISIQVIFSEDVILTNASPGNITLKLETGSTDQVATYASQPTANTLSFEYTVQAGDNSNDLNYFNTSALVLAGGATIEDVGTNNAILTLPPTASANSLAGSKALRIDTLAPNPPANVGFSGTSVNATTFAMTWTAGSDANFARYNSKICTNIDCATDCTSAGDTTLLTQNVTGLASTTYYGCVQTQDAVGLTSAFVNSVQTVTVDTAVPTVTGVSSSKADGAYKVAEIIPIQVSFSEDVYVLVPGDVKLKLETGATDRLIAYSSGTGTQTLTFTYTVQATDTSNDLNVFDANSLTVTPGGSIRDVAGNNANLTLATAGAGSLVSAKNLVIDTTAPAAPSVTSPAHTFYSTTDISNLSGTSEADALITVKDGSTTLGTVQASGTTWTLNLGSPLSDGVYTLTATATDAAGNLSVASSANTVTVDNSAPNAPIVSALTTPNTDSTPTVSGTSEAGMLIKVYADGVEVASTSANGSGVWSVTTSALSDGAKVITATATDLGPRTSADSASVPYVVDTTVPSAPSNIAFDQTLTNTGSVNISWTTSADTNFAKHQVKRCTDSGCSSCGSASDVAGVTTSWSSGLVEGTPYWACVRGQDTVNLSSAWVASSNSITYDGTVPSVVSVTSSTPNGAYKVGDVIEVDVNFSEDVSIVDFALTDIELPVGPNTRYAAYHSGHGTSTLHFRYTVASGDTTADLSYAASNSLRLRGATITDGAGNPANTNFVAPGALGSLNNAKALVVDTTAPTNPSSVSFPVSTTNSTSLALSWAAASDTNLSRYNTKICTNVGCSSGCIDTANTTSLNQTKTGVVGTSYYGCTQAQDTAGNLSSWVASAASILIDQTAPTVSNVSSTKADGPYKAGASIPITVTFTKVVTVTGTGVSLRLETGATDQNVAMTSGSGSTVLTFDYVVQAGDTSADLNTFDNAALTLGAATIKDAAGNNATLTLPWPTSNTLANNKALVIDTTAPAAPVISVPSSNYSMSNITVVSGTGEANAVITIKDGATIVGTATVAGGGTWSSTLDTTLTEGAHSLTAIATDPAGNVSTVSATRDVEVDTTGPSAPVLSAFTSPTNNTTPVFSGTSEPNMLITVYRGVTSLGTTTANGSGAWTMTSNAIPEGTYTITAQATDPGPRTSAASNSRSLTVDTTAPTVTSVSSTASNATYKIDDVIPITVTFNEAVTVTGTPTLALETGATDASVVYTSGTGTATLTFNYTVASPHAASDLDYTTITALVGAGIKDAATNNAILTLPSPGAAGSLGANKAIAVDGTRPAVLSVTSTNANGSYGFSNAIDITVTFSENVVVTGTPALALNTSPARSATYQSVSGAVATFRYTIVAADAAGDLNYAATNSLTVASASIKDAAGNDATLTLPGLAAGTSLGTQKDIVIVGGSNPPVLTPGYDTANAFVGSQTVVNVNNSATSNDTTNDGRAITYTCRYDTTVNGAVAGGAALCSTLPGTVTFGAANGVLTWTPNSTAQSSYTNFTEYEFMVTGTTNANTSATDIYTIKVLRPWSKTVDYLTAEAAQYSYSLSEVAFTGGKIALKALSQSNGPSDATWDSAASGAQFKPVDGFARLSNNGGCDGSSYNCNYVSNDHYPGEANRVFASTMSGKTGFYVDADTAKQPANSNTTKKSGGISQYFNGNDYLYTDRLVEDNFTVAFWFRSNSTYVNGGCDHFADGMGLISADKSGVANDWGITLCDGYVITGSGASGTDQTLISTAKYNDDRWHHVALVRTKSGGSLTLWIDNLRIGHITAGAGLALDAPTYFYYGARSTSSGHYTGYMDEVVIYDKNFSVAELGELYDRGASLRSGNYTSRIFDGQAAGTTWNYFRWKTNLPFGKELPSTNEATSQYPLVPVGFGDSLAGLWHMNENSANSAPGGTDYADSSGNDFHGNIQGSQYSHIHRGRFGNGLRLNGAGDLNIGNAFEFGTGSFTIAMWVKTMKLPTNDNFQVLATNGFDGWLSGYRLSIWQDLVNFGLCRPGGTAANCVLVDADSMISDGHWHHVVVTVNRTTNKLKIIVDGALSDLTKVPGTCGTVGADGLDFSACAAGLSANRSLGASYLGATYYGGSRDDAFVGVFDEVAGWSKAISDASIKQLYRRGSSRVSVWMRTCTQADCSDNPSWKGPSGASHIGFSELNNNSVPLTGTGTVNTAGLQISTSDYPSTAWGSNRYFQYRMRMEAEDRFQNCTYEGATDYCSPEVISVEVGPDHYPVRSEVVWNTATPFYNLQNFTEVIGSGGCSGGTWYNLSTDNSTWKYNASGTWGNSTISTHYNSQPWLDSTAGRTFGTQIGRSNLYVKAVLTSNSLTPCELDSFTISGNDFFE